MSKPRPTPETDAETAHKNDAYEFVNPPEWEWVVTSDFARKLERERDEALQWRREQMLVESQWDAQAVAKELGMPAGADIRKNILPAIQQLKRERNAMLEAMAETHKILLSIQLDDIFEDTMRSYAHLAMTKLKPFSP